MKKMTKYEMVMQYLKQYIREQPPASSDKLPTEMQLVQTLDVSRITVQRALHELQQQGLIRRVQGGGTYINRKDPAEASAQKTFVPIVLNNDSELFGSMKYVQGADTYLAENGCYLTVNNSHQNADEERALILRLIEDGFRCIIVSPYSAAENNCFYFHLMQQGIRFVFLDRIPEQLVTNFVACDNVHGGYLAAKHVIEQGATRVAFLSASLIETAQSLIQRKNGYLFAMQEKGLSIDPDLIGFAQPDKSVAALIDRMLALPEKLDAIVCANDITALEVLQHLQVLQLSVPDDIMLIGFDNLEMTMKASVPISTIEQPFFQLGYEAAKIAKQLIDGTEAQTIQRILPVQLIARESTQHRTQG